MPGFKGAVHENAPAAVRPGSARMSGDCSRNDRAFPTHYGAVPSHALYCGMPERVPAIKVVLLPKDTNALGTIFGGVILSHIDLASAVEARKTAPHRYVTKAMRSEER